MNTTKTIIAIGGGELRDQETLPMDQAIVRLSNKQNPKILFIPTASGDSEGYIEVVERVYGETLNCAVTALKILTESPADDEIREQILSADIIYVGGGNTAKMMTAWKEKHVDRYLWQAYHNGVILSGLSAGAICWFDAGYSDSFYADTGEYTTVKGLGMIPALCCPHFNAQLDFDGFMQRQKRPAIAIDDCCAVVFQNDAYKVVKAKESANAYLLVNHGGTIHKTVLDNIDFKPLQGEII